MLNECRQNVFMLWEQVLNKVIIGSNIQILGCLLAFSLCLIHLPQQISMTLHEELILDKDKIMKVLFKFLLDYLDNKPSLTVNNNDGL